jgi:hypothetical protein
MAKIVLIKTCLFNLVHAKKMMEGGFFPFHNERLRFYKPNRALDTAILSHRASSPAKPGL